MISANFKRAYGIVDPNEGATPLPAERAMGSSGGEGPTESPHRWLRGAAGGSANRVGGALIEDGVAYLRDPSGACAAIPPNTSTNAPEQGRFQTQEAGDELDVHRVEFCGSTRKQHATTERATASSGGGLDWTGLERM